MKDAVILLILAVVLIVGIRSSIKHLKGEGACCGGSSAAKHKRKKLKHVVAKKTFVVEGMTCEHCKNRVESAIDAMDGAAGKVNLRKKELLVSMEKEISEEKICAAVEKAGYQVQGIK